MKNFFKIALSVISSVIILMIVFIAINLLKTSDFDDLSDMDQQMLVDLAQTHRMYKEYRDLIWTESYDFSEVPLVLTPVSKDHGIWHTHSYAIGIPELERSIFTKAVKLPQELGLPNVYRISGVHPSLWWTWFPFNFTFDSIGQTHTMFMKYSNGNFEKNSGLSEFKYFLMHEAFHEFVQLPNWPHVLELQSIMSSNERSIEMYQWFMMETAILDAINQETDLDALNLLLVDFITVRNHRYDKWPSRKEEMAIETLEGTAKYIEEKYKTLPNVLQEKENKFVFAAFFLGEQFTDILERGEITSVMDKDIFYFTGASLGLAMDSLQMDWKKEIEQGALLYDILEKKFKNIEPRNLEQIKKEYNFDDFEKPAKALLAYFNAD